MIILLTVFYFSIVALAIVVFRQDRKIEKMKQIMEQERPIFAALKVQEGIKRILAKAKDDVEFFKMIDKEFKSNGK